MHVITLKAIFAATWMFSMGVFAAQLAPGINEGVHPAVLEAASDNIARVSGAVKARGPDDPLKGLPMVHYVVPAISSIMRLPEDFPEDGELGGLLRLIAARGEFAPGSFLAFAFTDMKDVVISTTSLRGPGGEIPAENIDVKIVKIWYQSGGGWHSYFADQTGRMRVPELLLNDETLIHVDHEKRDNYLRVDYPEGSQYVWISNPLSVDIPFNTQKEPVADAPNLKPVRLDAGAFKQFWVTVKAPNKAASGVYSGNITFSQGSHSLEIPISVRVLPFELPIPRTYYDLDREFYTMLYNRPGYAGILNDNGGDHEHAERKLMAIFENMRNHNIMHPRVPDLPRNWQAADKKAFARHLELMQRAGLSTDTIFGAVPGIPEHGWMMSVRGVPLAEQSVYESYIERIKAASAIVEETLGHANVYCFGWDEPGNMLMIAQRKPWTYVHNKGLKTYSTGRAGHLDVGGYNIDMINLPGESALTREETEAWRRMGALALNYAGPHTGPENPEFMRRVHGMRLYKANYDGIGNYILDSTRWNDFLGDVHNFRGFNMTYGTRDGVIDTLQWEGVREAVDDVRYATLLRKLAHEFINDGNIDARYDARMALLWLELLDEKTADLNAVRLEMINHIMKLRAFAENG